MAQAPNPEDREAAPPASKQPKATPPRKAPGPAKKAAAGPPMKAAPPPASRTSRAEMARSNRMRPPVGGGFETQGQLYVDPAAIPPGMEAQWVRETCTGQYDDGNVQLNLEQRGFEPATTDEFPELAPRYLPGRRPDGNLIRRGGQVLMLRPKAVGDMERRQRKLADAATLRSVNKELERGADGKAVQALPDAGVTVVTDRGDGISPNERFHDA